MSKSVKVKAKKKKWTDEWFVEKKGLREIGLKILFFSFEEESEKGRRR